VLLILSVKLDLGWSKACKLLEGSGGAEVVWRLSSSSCAVGGYLEMGHYVSTSSVSHCSCYAKGATVQDETNWTHLLLKTLIKDEFKK
jgi:hypothetical protein